MDPQIQEGKGLETRNLYDCLWRPSFTAYIRPIFAGSRGYLASLDSPPLKPVINPIFDVIDQIDNLG